MTPAPVPSSDPTGRGVGRVVSRRLVLQLSGVAALATGASMMSLPAHAATPNSLMAGGEGSTKALGRTEMPPVSGDFRISFDYLYPAGAMSAYSVFASFDTAYRGPQVSQSGDRWTVTTVEGGYLLEQAITADQWHRVVLDFAASGTVAILVDGQRLTSGVTAQFPIEDNVTLTYFGWIGDLSTATYNGTAFFDNLEVTKDGATTFHRTFDDGAAINWTQTGVAGQGIFGLANPARDAEVATLAEVELELPAVGYVGGESVLHVAGSSADGRGVLVESGSVQLTVDQSQLTVRTEAGAYFALSPQQLGTATVTAVVSQDGVTRTLTGELVIREGGSPGRVELTSPLESIFVGDHLALNRHVYALNGTELSADAVTWAFTAAPESAATVDAEGVVTAREPGTVTITATASAGGVDVSATLDLGVAVLETVKTRPSYWTAERRTAAAANIAQFAWAAASRDAAIASAKPYLDLGFEKLWSLVTAQTIPRSYAFSSNEQQGCLNCGTDVHAFGQYPYSADVWDKPWKITCPSCQLDFPTNDFAAYYAGGLDRNGLFDPVQARTHNAELIAGGGQGNLVNVGSPEKGETWGVEDGAGTILENGTRYTPVAYYTHWKLWHGGELSTAIDALTSAYLYTGDAQYASLGVVLLDRVADVYPAMNLDDWTYPNGYLNSNGNTSRGKVVGSIWETGHVRRYLLAYDAFYPALADGATAPVSAEALQFLDGASTMMDKTNPKRVRRNIEDGLLRAILPAVKRGEIRGNNGMHQATLAASAVVLDHLPETQEWLEFNFASGVATGTSVTGGNLGTTFVDQVDRDGNGDEAAPGYNSLWLGNFTLTADYLDGYHLEGLPNYDLYANPKYLKMFDGMYPLTMLGRYTPTIGDTGYTGNPVQSTTQGSMLTAFVKTEKPIYAQVLHSLNNHSSTGLRLGIFDTDPEAVAAKIESAVTEHGRWEETSRMLTGFGFAALRDGAVPAIPPPSNGDISFSAMKITEQSKPTKYFDSNGTTQFEASEVGDHITFEFTLTAAVAEQLKLDVWKAASYGVYSVAVDGTVLAERFSFFGSGAVVENVAPVELAAGEHTLTLTLVEAVPGAKCGVRRLMFGEDTGPVDPGTQRGSTVYFGRNRGHGHRDTLNLDHWAFGLDLLPDMGYPRYANAIDMHRKSLVVNTVSHNTVVVDDAGQDAVVVGEPKLFDSGPEVQVVDIDAPKAYAKVDRYRRTAVQVRIDEENSYLVDLFRVTGGGKHLYSFHGMEASEVTVDGVDLAPQQDSSGAYVGSYAGPSVPYKDTVDDPTGYSYFFDVDRAAGDFGNFSATWSKLADTWGVLGNGAGSITDVNLRLTLLGDHSDVALASCEPPQNKPGNPKQLRYLLARSRETGGASCFTGVIEAYRGDRLVQSVEVVPVTTAEGGAVTAQDVRAVRITLVGGRVDLIVHALDSSKTYLVEDRRFTGSLGVWTTQPGQSDRVHLVDGSEFGSVIYAQLPALTGTVAAFTTELTTTNSITLTLDADQSFLVAADDLVGRYVFAEDDGVRNAVYRIESVESWEAGTAVVSIGNVSPIRQYVDPKDFTKGFVHDLAVGRSWRIPLRTTEPTDGAAWMRTLLDHYGKESPVLADGRVALLVDRAAEHQSAGRLDAARHTVETLATQLSGLKKQIGAAAYGWLEATVQGWLRQLAG